MKQSLVNVARSLFVLLLFVPAPLAVVGTPTAVASMVQTATDEPAVVLPEAGEEETEDPWTARYLGPVVVGLAVVAVGAAAAYYVVAIRGRYRVVE